MNTQTMNEDNVRYVAICCGPNAGRTVFWGVGLICLGGLGLLSLFVPLQPLGRFIWPLFLVLWGGMLLLSLRRSQA